MTEYLEAVRALPVGARLALWVWLRRWRRSPGRVWWVWTEEGWRVYG